MKDFLVKRWFLIALFATLAVGIGAAPSLEELAGQRIVRNLIVAAVLFLMALPLEFRAMWQSLMHPGPPLLAVFVNMGLLPLFAWLVSFSLSDEMGPGLLVAATTPCTLASASVWTRRAGGNDAVSILVTIITNGFCFVVTPLWLVTMTGKTIDNPELSLGSMIVKLGLLVVLPMIFAQLVRLNGRVGPWATANKVPLNTLAQCGILSMVLIGAVGTGIRLRGADMELGADLLSMLAAVLVVHLGMFWVALRLAQLFGFSREDQIAVGFAGSQKTLMVGLLVAVSLQITILPMVAYHVGQLLVDTLIADRFRAQVKP